MQTFCHLAPRADALEAPVSGFSGRGSARSSLHRLSTTPSLPHADRAHGVSKVETTTHACAFSAAFSTFNFRASNLGSRGADGRGPCRVAAVLFLPQNHQTERRQMKPFQRTPMFARITSTVAATLLAAGCRDATAPNAHSLRPAQPAFAVSGASAEAQGTGSIGTGTASPGSSRQDVD